jgi:hypothetical protein
MFNVHKNDRLAQLEKDLNARYLTGYSENHKGNHLLYIYTADKNHKLSQKYRQRVQGFVYSMTLEPHL